VHQLPVNIDTLWLRLMGRGKVQARAVQEVLALPEDYPYRLETLRHLTQLRLYLEMRQNKSRDLKEVIMNISAAYEEWETKTIAKGVELGKKRGVKLGDTAARLEIAQQLLANSMPIEKVANLTKLSLEQIQAIATQS
jgi:predicted transposase/invertase (TIGR01784 family)